MSRNVKPLTWQAILLRWAPWMGGLLFFAWCVIFTWHGPGLQYDEALSVHGAVDLTAKAARSITCAGVVDVQVGRRCWPLMIAPYVGAVKDYVAAPLFRLFGIRVAAARMAAALFGALGIIGCAIFLRDRIGPLTGAAFALLMCAQPAYLDQVLFDNGNIAVTVGFIGIIAWTGNRFIQSARAAWGFVLGAACGLAVWGRLNFLWILAAVAAGIAVAFPWKRWLQARAWLLLLSGALAGAFPMLSYHWENRSALGSFMRSNSTYHDLGTFAPYLVYRTRMLSEVLFSDREHRAIWDGDKPFNSGADFCWTIAVAAGLYCILRRPANLDEERWTRCLGIALIVLIAICLTTQLQVAQHHLVVLIPFIAVCVITPLLDLAKRGRAGTAFALTLSIAYAGASFEFDRHAAVALHRTRGLDMWSDGIDSAASVLQSDRSPMPLSVLDWGLQANLFFLSKAALAPPELFWGADLERSGRQLTWTEEVAAGGRFLTTAAQDRALPTATLGFEKALHDTKAQFHTQVFAQRDGKPYALLYEVEAKK